MPYREIKLFESRVEDDEVAARIVRAAALDAGVLIATSARRPRCSSPRR